MIVFLIFQVNDASQHRPSSDKKKNEKQVTIQFPAMFLIIQFIIYLYRQFRKLSNSCNCNTVIKMK